LYDVNDTESTSGNFGSFQVHDVTTPGAYSTVMAWNQHAVATPDIGLGNHTGAHPDWTFSAAQSLRTTSTTAWKLDIRVNKNPLQTLTGGSAVAATPPAPWSAYGQAGGAVQVVASQAGSGGGGAGAAGADVPDTSNQTVNGVLQARVAGNGGAGRSVTISGSAVAYGGGGGGGTRQTGSDICSAGGAGGGGRGACTDLGAGAAIAGTNGVGGGGGGGHDTAGAPGGSGTVIVRYLHDVVGVRNLVAAESATTALLRWQEPDGLSVPVRTTAGYRIEYAPSASDTWTQITPTALNFTAPDMFEATVTPPQSSGLYKFRVTPLYGDGDTTDGASQTVTATAKGGDSVTLVTVGTQPYFLHTYTTTGSSTFAVDGPLDVEYLVVAGGGGGGFGNSNEGGGGGGAGGLRTNLEAPTTVGSAETTALAVAVGAGGNGGTSTTSSGSNGANSQFESVVATGGGGGGSCDANAGAGGSGGGGSGCSRDRPGGGASPAGQGHAGGAGRWIHHSPGNGNGGGGGGAGSAGGNGAARTRATTGGGGAGLANTITGTAVTYAVGGDGFAGAPSGGQTNGLGAQGTANRGNGGGGSAQQTGARGGSGIVVVRHAAVPRA
jgi:hypothetical protein